MKNSNISLTKGGVMTITFPGRGVSLQMTGKSGRKCGHREGKVKLSGDSRPTVHRVGLERRDLTATQNVAHQIIHLSAQVIEAWANELLWEEKKAKKLLFQPEYRLQYRLNEHFEEITRAAGMTTARCTFKFESE